jgi:hypothetical protein
MTETKTVAVFQEDIDIAEATQLPPPLVRLILAYRFKPSFPLGRAIKEHPVTLYPRARYGDCAYMFGRHTRVVATDAGVYSPPLQHVYDLAVDGEYKGICIDCAVWHLKKLYHEADRSATHYQIEFDRMHEDSGSHWRIRTVPS